MNQYYSRPCYAHFPLHGLQLGFIREVMSVLTPLEQIISLAISEAFAGSDVAGLRTTATKSEDGKTWTINGTKKWISGGMHSDYFVRGHLPNSSGRAVQSTR